MKESTTTRISAEALRKADRNESRTDRERLRRMTESELEESIASDPDWNRVPQDWYLKAQAVMPTPKKLVSVRLDADLLAWFKGLGRGYQTRMNAVLRSFMDEEKKRGAGGRSR